MAIALTPRTEPDLTSAAAGRRDWRTIIFQGVAALLVVAVAAAISPMLLTPWVAADPPTHDHIPELHKWHDSFIAAYYCLLVGGTLLAAIKRPRARPILVQFLLLSFAILILLALHPLIVPILLVKLIAGALLATTYPAPRALFALPRASRVSWPLLALALVTAVTLLPDAWTNLRLQQTDVSEHATLGHWNGVAGVAVSLALAGVLAASHRPGSRALGIVVGVTYLYLGAAALALPRHDGSWGESGGLLAIVAGVAFLAVTVAEGFRATQHEYEESR